jgi:hypothetical protein
LRHEALTHLKVRLLHYRVMKVFLFLKTHLILVRLEFFHALVLEVFKMLLLQLELENLSSLIIR